MILLEILALIVFLVCSIVGAVMVFLFLGAWLGLWGLMLGISRDVGHEHDDEGNCIPPERKSRKAETPVQWKPDGSHERID